jgi:hypothetical protein
MRILAVTLSICVWCPTMASAARSAKLNMSFTPYRLGASTTIVFGFDIPDAGDSTSSPITRVDLEMPATIAYNTSTLGLARCFPERLSQQGLVGCPQNARIGLGTARVAVPLGSQTLTETVAVTTLVGNSENGHIEVLYYATGDTPVIAQFILPGELLSSATGEHMTTSIPLIPTLPGAPNVALIYFRATIGPSHLYYYAHDHGRQVRYRPRGISLPTSCPRRGFPFSATFSFQDGSSATAKDTVKCPRRTTGTARRVAHLISHTGWRRAIQMKRVEECFQWSDAACTQGSIGRHDAMLMSAVHLPSTRVHLPSTTFGA